ncbi:hypothetical protein [Streptomyces johnsoniae]|uniref:Uncharacterized protein n=1 Tax=Streptomyces johnsoniae TaxID=3075532 RepID=A0ABU2S4D3_9ACTN|nr:hypothetical protein [Streptomyces sp. DSM 41886]MDT0442679.1 hypothetical protein [Streptomyces sp. DSM 41886]
MKTSAKVGSFGAGLTLMFGAAFGVGSAVGPIGEDEEPAHTDPPAHTDGHADREAEPRPPAAPGGLQHEGAVHTAQFTVATSGAGGHGSGHGH